jgi:hypothetical protein
MLHRERLEQRRFERLFERFSSHRFECVGEDLICEVGVYWGVSGGCDREGILGCNTVEELCRKSLAIDRNKDERVRGMYLYGSKVPELHSKRCS